MGAISREKLFRLMCKNRLNSTALCRKAGISAVALRAIMSGKTKTAQADTVGKLADALGVDCLELVEMG